jgi:CheY-like chemotaxis protein
LEVLEWMRQQSGLRRIPVLVLTSSRENQDVDRAYDLGANSYLIKPVRFEDLNKMVQILESYWLQLNQFPSSLSTA